jgi:hypothetical protein
MLGNRLSICGMACPFLPLMDLNMTCRQQKKFGRNLTKTVDWKIMEEAKKLIAHIPAENLLCFDRGYPSYEFI